MKFKKMMLVPYKDDDKNINYELMNNKELNAPVKLDLIHKSINKLKNEKFDENINEDSDKIKNYLNKKQALKTITKLNEIDKIINKRIQKLNKKSNIKHYENHEYNESIKPNSVETFTPLIDDIVRHKKPVKRRLSYQKLDIKNPKRQKINKLDVTRGHKIEYLPDESMNNLDSDYEYYGRFSEYRNTPINSKNINIENNRKKNITKQIKKKLKKLEINKTKNLNYLPDESMILSDNDENDIDNGKFTRYANKSLLQDFMLDTREKKKIWSEFKND